MAWMTILRSIDFSRATASAICSSSSRLALIPARAMASMLLPFSLRLRGLVGASEPSARGVLRSLLGARQRFANKLVRQHQLGIAQSSATGQPDDLPARSGRDRPRCEPRRPRTLEHAPEALASRHRLRELDLGFVAQPSPRNRRPDQRPVDAGRGDLEPISAGNRIVRRRAPATAASRSPRNRRW